MNIIEYSKKAHEAAKVKGWWDEEKPTEVYLMLIISELSECMEADRKGRQANIEKFNKYVKTLTPDNFNRETYPTDEQVNAAINNKWKTHFEYCIKDTVEDELADTVIRVLDLIGYKLSIGEVPDKSAIGYYQQFQFHSQCKEPLVSHLFQCTNSVANQYGGIVTLLETLVLCEKYCQKNNIDLIWHIEQKMKYNETRTHKHGGKAY